MSSNLLLCKKFEAGDSVTVNGVNLYDEVNEHLSHRFVDERLIWSAADEIIRLYQWFLNKHETARYALSWVSVSLIRWREDVFPCMVSCGLWPLRISFL